MTSQINLKRPPNSIEREIERRLDAAYNDLISGRIDDAEYHFARKSVEIWAVAQYDRANRMGG